MEFNENSDPCPALTRGLQLLRMLCKNGPLPLERLAKLSGWPKSSVFRLLVSLEAFGAVERDPVDRRYRATQRLVPFAPVAEDARLRTQAVMKDLVRRAHHTIELFIWNDGALTMVDRCEPEEREVAVRARIGWRPDSTEAFALTIAALAWADSATPALKQRYWRWKFNERLTVAATELRECISEAREQGVAICAFPNVHGVRRYAVPVRDSSGSLWGALSIAAVPAPLKGTEHEALRRLILDAAESLNHCAAAQTAS